MPSFFRQRSSSPNYIFSVPAAIPTKAVGFVSGPTPVTAISRPLTNIELWTLYDFEMHARACANCRDPYEVHRADCSLCEHGHRLAQGVASIVWSRADGREIYDYSSPYLVRVEIPQGHDEVTSLLKAMERSLRHKHRRPIVSFDRAYVNPERTPQTVHRAPERKRSVKEASPLRTKQENQQSPSRSKSVREAPSTEESERRAPEVVDWPDAEYQIREPSRVIQPNQTTRPATPEKKRSERTEKVERTSSPSKSSSTSSPKRTSVQAAQPSNRYSFVPAPEPVVRLRPSSSSSEDKKLRRQSMLVQSFSYDTEVREPKARPRRMSTVIS